MRIKNFFLNRTARAGAFLAAMALMLGFAPSANAAAGNNNIKIIAWYGAGNLASSEYARDTVILFNPTQAPITMNGWTLQTGSTSGAFSNVSTVFKLPNVTLPAGGYYAITGSGVNYISSTGCTTAHCNLNYPFDYQLRTIEGTASDTDNIFSSTSVVVALAKSTTPLGSTCAAAMANSDLVDMVGIGAGDGSSPVTCYAGGGSAPYKPTKVNGTTVNYHNTSYAYGTIRRNRCTDTFNNTEDWTLGYIDYKNSSSTPEPCPVGTQTSVTDVVASPNNPVKGTTFLLTANVTAGTGTTLQTVTADLSNIAGSAAATMYDDGTHGDVIAGDGTYSLSATVPSTQAINMVLGMSVTATDSTGNHVTSPIAFTVSTSTTSYSNAPGPGNNNIRMIAFYGAGNLSGSEYARDTLILFNPTQHAITMNNWSIQLGGAAGVFTAVSFKLPVVTMPAGGYYAITGSGPAYGVGGCKSDHCNLDYPFDYQVNTIEGSASTTQNTFASTVYSLALVDNQTALGSVGNCPKESAHVVDMLNVGSVTGSSVPTCYLGTSYAPYTPTTWPGTGANDPPTSIHGIKYAYATVRTNKCVSTWDEARDWTLGYIDYKNSTSAPQPCLPGPATSQLRVTATATPNDVHALDTVTFTANVAPSTGAQASSVTADLSNLGLSDSTVMYDDGTNGDAHAHDNVFTVKGIPTSAPYFGQQVALNVTAKDTNGQTAQASTALTIEGGTIALSSNSGLTATIKAGEVAYFDLSIKSIGGYFGTVILTCEGTPHTDGKLTPTKTQCVMTPPQVTMVSGGTGKSKLAIAAGTTKLSGFSGSRSVPLTLITILSMMLFAVAIWRRKHLPLASLLALVCFLSLQTTGCETNAGLGNTDAAPGVYTYTVTGADANTVSINNSITFTVTVQ